MLNIQLDEIFVILKKFILTESMIEFHIYRTVTSWF